MQRDVHYTDTRDAELIELLGAISVVSKRLATNLSKLVGQTQSTKGGKSYEQDERTIPCSRRTAQMW